MVVTGVVGEVLVFRKLKEKLKGFEWEHLGNRNKKDYDIIGTRQHDKSEIKVQVKTVKAGEWSLNMKKFLRFNQSKLQENIQEVTGINKELSKNVDFFIFVYLDNFKEEKITVEKQKMIITFGDYTPEFYVIKTTDLQHLLGKRYSKWLKGLKDPGRRPRNPKSFHSCSSRENLGDGIDNWDIIK